MTNNPTAPQILTLARCVGYKDGWPLAQELAENDPLRLAIEKELASPYHRQLIAVTASAFHLLGNQTKRLVLLLSDQDGGFAKTGLYWDQSEGRVSKGKVEQAKRSPIFAPDQAYVELVLDQDRVDQGALHIFGHELAHVLMDLVIPQYPKGKSVKQHVSMGITDYFMAFYEGWGICFESFAHDHMDKYKKATRDLYSPDRDQVNKWHSYVDAELRLRCVQQNQYIYQKARPASWHEDLPLTEKILLEHTSPLFDCTRVRNAQELLSSEGVMATIFYRLCMDTDLKNSAMPKEVQQAFGLDTRKTPLAPLENILLKHVWIFWQIKDQVVDEQSPVFPFIKAWSTWFPEDKATLIHLFLQTTVGRTVTDDLASLHEQIGHHGLMGHVDDLRQGIGSYRKRLETIEKEVMIDWTLLDQNVGQEDWVQCPDTQIPTCLWIPDQTQALWVNRHTATPTEQELIEKTKVEGQL